MTAALLTPRHRLLLGSASLVVALLAIAGAAQGPRLVAQLVLGGAAIAAGVLLTTKRRRSTAFALQQRLAVIQRVGLSTRTAAALLEVDGQRFLVVHGDGFATVQATTPPTLVAPTPAGDVP